LFGGKTREVAPLYAVQSGLSYTFAPGGWVELNAGYFKGGRTTVDDVPEISMGYASMRFGINLSVHWTLVLFTIGNVCPKMKIAFA
jgi:hypothetical protein